MSKRVVETLMFLGFFILAACPSGSDPVVAYTLTVQKAGDGTGTVTGGDINCGSSCTQAHIDKSTTVTLTALPDVGATFGNWTGCDSTSGTICVFKMTADKTVTATFNHQSQATHTLTISKSGGGTVTGGPINCGSTCSATGIVAGATVTLTAMPDPGATFESWSGCDSTSGTSCTLTMNGDRAVAASFTAPPAGYTLTVGKSGTGSGMVSGGSIGCGSACEQTEISAGTMITLTASAAPGSHFTNWSGCDSMSGTTCNVTVNSNRAVTATFDLIETESLSVAKDGTGTGTVTGPGISCGSTCIVSGIANGTAVTLTASATSGSSFTRWSGCDSTSGATCIVTMSADRTVTATFSAITHVLTVTKNGTGTGSVTGASIDCGSSCTGRGIPDGAVVTLTAAADSGSRFTSWSGCDNISGTTCSLTMSADRTLAVTFTADPIPAQIDFWTNDATDGYVEVYIDGVPQGRLTNYVFYPYQPSWGAPETLLIGGIPPGVHTVSAISDSSVEWPAMQVNLTEGERLPWQFVATQWCFWTSVGIFGNIAIYIDGTYVGQLTNYYSSTPAWNATGTLVVNTTSGVHYLYAAAQTGETWSDTISLDEGQQQFHQLGF